MKAVIFQCCALKESDCKALSLFISCKILLNFKLSSSVSPGICENISVKMSKSIRSSWTNSTSGFYRRMRVEKKMIFLISQGFKRNTFINSLEEFRWHLCHYCSIFAIHFPQTTCHNCQYCDFLLMEVSFLTFWYVLSHGGYGNLCSLSFYWLYLSSHPLILLLILIFIFF